MSEKRIIVSILAVVIVLGLLLFGSYSFLSNRFANIEKKQDEVLSQLAKGAVAGVSIEGEYAEQDSSSYALTQEIGRLRKKIVVLESQVDQHDELLGFMDASESASTTEIPQDSTELHFVTIADQKWKVIDVFQDKNSSSQIVGQAIFGQAYQYIKKENEYYNIKLNDNVKGWIHQQFVKEY